MEELKKIGDKKVELIKNKMLMIDRKISMRTKSFGAHFSFVLWCSRKLEKKGFIAIALLYFKW